MLGKDEGFVRMVPRAAVSYSKHRSRSDSIKGCTAL